MEQPPPIPVLSRTKSKLGWWIGGVGVALLLAVWILAAVAIRRASRDSPEVDDRSMLPLWSERGGETNPLAVFCREIETTTIHEVAELPRPVLKREKGTEVQMRDFLSRQDRAMATFEKLMATNPSSWQWPGGARIAERDYESKYISALGEIIQILRMKIHLLCFEGKSQEAATLSLTVSKFGRALSQAEGMLLQMLIGITAQFSGEDGLQQSLTASPASSVLVQTCLEELRKCGALQREDYQFVVRAEYLGFKNHLDKLSGGTWLDQGTSQGDSAFLKGANLVYKRNQTIADWYGLNQPIVEALENNWKDGLAACRVSDKIVEGYPSSKAPLSFIDSNVTGRVLIRLTWSNYSRMLEKAMLSATMHDEAEVMLALRLFEIEYGKLPSSLAELTPKYLPAVPTDPFSDGPLSWQSASGLVYSIGPNGKDDEGNVNAEKPTKGADVGMRYWWFEISSTQGAR